MDDALSLPELRTLRQDNPQRLFRHLADVQRSFLFGIEDHREEDERWGGEVRVIVNKNVELHFVPCFNESMRTKEELPQFCVFPSEERADSVEDTSLRLEEDDETIEGAIFYVDPTEYDVLLGAAIEVLEHYEDWDVIPDTYFLESPLVQFIDRTVLEHTAVRAEREYDFRRGLVGGAPPPQEELEDEPAPVIADEDDPDYTPHPDLLGGDDEDEGLDDRGTDDDDDGEGGDSDDDEDEGGRPKHFRTIWT
jgi:hypothetical protein